MGQKGQRVVLSTGTERTGRWHTLIPCLIIKPVNIQPAGRQTIISPVSVLRKERRPPFILARVFHYAYNILAGPIQGGGHLIMAPVMTSLCQLYEPLIAGRSRRSAKMQVISTHAFSCNPSRLQLGEITCADFDGRSKGRTEKLASSPSRSNRALCRFYDGLKLAQTERLLSRPQNLT